MDEIALLASDGDPAATQVLEHAYTALAETVAPWLVGFRTDVLAIGGSIAQSWELVERWFSPTIEAHFRKYRTPPPRIVQGQGGEEAALIGATIYARRTGP